MEINHQQSPLTIHAPNHITFLTYHNSEHHYYIRWNVQTSLDSEDDFRSGCWSVSLYQEHFSRLFSPRRSDSIEVVTPGFKPFSISRMKLFPLLWKCFFAKINFRCYCPVYYSEKDFWPYIFPSGVVSFQSKKVGRFFLAHGRQFKRMELVYFVTSSQCFIRPRNKHKP